MQVRLLPAQRFLSFSFRLFSGVVAPRESVCLASRRMRVQVPPTPFREVTRIRPVTQLAECLAYIEEVGGSSPSGMNFLSIGFFHHGDTEARRGKCSVSPW